MPRKPKVPYTVIYAGVRAAGTPLAEHVAAAWDLIEASSLPADHPLADEARAVREAAVQYVTSLPLL